MKNRAIYPGTFDPITNGHIDIIKRAAQIFPEIIVGVASNEAKSPFFPLEIRIKLIQDALEGISGVNVIGFDTLLIDFVKEQQGNIILRGLRAVNDFEYEFQLAGMNRKLCAEIETVFLTPSEHLMFISSTLVREIAKLKGDVSQFVPLEVVEAFNQRLSKRYD
jgi:pantetheine-phosphate adenylyltransferase